MASVNAVIEGLTILAKYDPKGLDSRNIAAEHDVLYGPGKGPEVMSEGDRKRLEELGWRWDDKADSWARFV